MSLASPVTQENTSPLESPRHQQQNRPPHQQLLAQQLQLQQMQLLGQQVQGQLSPTHPQHQQHLQERQHQMPQHSSGVSKMTRTESLQKERSGYSQQRKSPQRGRSTKKAVEIRYTLSPPPWEDRESKRRGKGIGPEAGSFPPPQRFVRQTRRARDRLQSSIEPRTNHAPSGVTEATRPAVPLTPSAHTSAPDPIGVESGAGLREKPGDEEAKKQDILQELENINEQLQQLTGEEISSEERTKKERSAAALAELSEYMSQVERDQAQEQRHGQAHGKDSAGSAIASIPPQIGKVLHQDSIKVCLGSGLCSCDQIITLPPNPPEIKKTTGDVSTRGELYMHQCWLNLIAARQPSPTLHRFPLPSSAHQN